ncbi:hypothetical protein BDW75DRAFT_248916 [Aspergillus navahoensis]
MYKRGSTRFEASFNPATEEVTAHVHEAQQEDVDDAVDAAVAAFPAWSSLGGFDRAAYFYRLADFMGRPISTYKEPLASARFLRYMAGKATDIQGESSLQTAGFVNITLRQPYGACAAITPWNAPVTMLTFKMAPALISGNTLVVKSSEKAPLTSIYIAKLMREVGFPPGVINVLTGFGRPCGEALASYMKIRKISLTGSVAAGKAVQEAAARSNLKKVTLELGGKSPLVIFDDAYLDRAADEAALSILLNSGQDCIASSRVYIHESVASEFRPKLVRALEEKGQNPPGDNNPLSSGTRRGPQADRQQFERIQQFIKEVREGSTEILTGGHREGEKGFYVQPALVWKPNEKSRVMTEEIFGPVQCLTTFLNEDEVLARANDSEFGLYASVFTKDVSRALRFAKAFESGNVGVNVTSPMMTHDMPFGGVKQSGQGKELGSHGLEEWTELT